MEQIRINGSLYDFQIIQAYPSFNPKHEVVLVLACHVGPMQIQLCQVLELQETLVQGTMDLIFAL